VAGILRFLVAGERNKVGARKKAGFMISVVAKTFEVHPQTLRLYERLGLLKPSRSDGNTRLYTESDLMRLETILSLTRDLGINLAGVEVILNMREKMAQMQNEMAQMIQFVQEHLSQTGVAAGRDALVRVPASMLIRSARERK
jgi:MerR family transcriptional regulator/heat shock protein HspR